MKNDFGISKGIETPFLKIRKNCLEIQNTVIQLSNISLLSTKDVTPPKFPVFSIILILAGLVLLGDFTPFALVALVVGVGWICMWAAWLYDLKKLKRLTIITNSGNVFPIVFENKEFLDKVATILTDIIRDPTHDRSITINVKGCTFTDDSHVL